MRLKNALVVLVAGGAMLIGSSAEAHIPFVEPEAREDAPASLSESERATMDYSFQNPFPLPEDRALRDMNDFQYDGIDSMALNGYLVPGDVDVFEVVPAPNDGVPFLGEAILAAALPPACEELLDAYPLVALVGPELAREQSVLDVLPFDIDDPEAVPQPAGDRMNGAILAPNPEIDPREIFVEDVVTGLSWFLPAGQTQTCLEPPSIPLQDCETLDNSILVSTALGDDLAVGEPYYIAIWDPQGREQDYTLTLGVTDAHYVDRPDVNAEIECFKLIHGDCTPPYPEDELPEGYINELCNKSVDEPGAPAAGGSSSGCSVGALGKSSAPILAAVMLLAAVLLRRRLLRH